MIDSELEEHHVQRDENGTDPLLDSFISGIRFSGACFETDPSTDMADGAASSNSSGATSKSDRLTTSSGEEPHDPSEGGLPSETESSTSASGGSKDSGGETGGAVPPSQRKRVFFFKNGTLGKLQDSTDRRPALEAADEECTNGAMQLGLGGSWRAWLSSSEVDAIDRISDVGPWYRLDQETLLFASKADLEHGPEVRIDPSDASDDWDACVQHAGCALAFWSGTAQDGRHTSDNCSDWTEYLGLMGTVGRADVAGTDWVAADSVYCGAYLGLLCIEQ